MYLSSVFYMLRRNGLAKNILQKDIIYYFKYRELSGIFTINYHISDNSIQINTKFAFTVYEYILLSKLIYIYIYIYICILYIYIHFIYMYVYIYMNFVCFVYYNIVATHTQDGHTGFTFK